MKNNDNALEKAIGTGVFAGLINYGALIGALYLVFGFIHEYFADKDSTDPADGRSGLVIKIDYKTGCEYLSTGHGGLHPRMDQDGTTQLGCRELHKYPPIRRKLSY